MLRGGQVKPTGKKGEAPPPAETKKKEEEKPPEQPKKSKAKESAYMPAAPKPKPSKKPKDLNLFAKDAGKLISGLFEDHDLPPEKVSKKGLSEDPLAADFELEGKKKGKKKPSGPAKAAGPKPKAKGPKGEKKAAGLESAAKGKPKIKGGTAKILYDPGMVKAVSKLSKEKQEAYINSQPSYLQPQIRAELKKLADEG